MSADPGSQTSMDPSERRGLDTALDLGVFAPLGFALQFRTLVPELAEAGRRQVAFSQSLGRAAIASVLKGVKADGSARSGSSTTLQPVDGYDDLTARDVVRLLRECDAGTAAWINQRETSGKARVTVLRAVVARTDAP